jgi:hypothetical protein
MDRRRLSEDQELLELQRSLTELTVRVRELRSRRSSNPLTTPRPTRQVHRSFRIGDRVHFQLNGITVEGVIIDRTPRRFRIRHTDTGHIYLRSDTTITLIV